MTGVVPPTIERPKTVIGVGMREMVILGIGLVIALLVVISPMSLILKVGFAVLLNRVGRASDDAFGYDDSGFQVTLNDLAPFK